MNITNKFLLIAATIGLVHVCLAQSSTADIVIISRIDRATFDVGAGVGSVLDRRRVTDVFDDSGALTGLFTLVESYDAFAAFDNGMISGTANASGNLDYVSNVFNNGAGLLAINSAVSSGSASSTGDGVAFANTSGGIDMRFTIDEALTFSAVGSFNPAPGDEMFLGSFNSGRIFTVSTQSTFNFSGILQPDTYRFFVRNSDSIIDGNPSYGFGQDVTFRVGAAIPEPGSSIVIVAMGGLLATFRHQRA